MSLTLGRGLVGRTLPPTVGGAVPVVVGVNYSQLDTAGGGERLVAEVDDATDCTALKVDGVACTGFALDDATHVSGVPAAHAAATGLDVVVTNTTGDSTTGTGLIEYWSPEEDAAVTLLYDAISSPYAAGSWTPRYGTNPTLAAPAGNPAASGGAPVHDGDGATEQGLKTTGTMDTYVSADGAGGGTGCKGSIAFVASSTTTAHADDYTMPVVAGTAEPGPTFALGAGLVDFGGGYEHAVTAIHYDVTYNLCSVAWDGALAAIVYRAANDGSNFDVSVNGALAGAGYNSAAPAGGFGFAAAFTPYPIDQGVEYPANDPAYQLFAGTVKAKAIMNDVASNTFVTKWHLWSKQRFGVAA